MMEELLKPFRVPSEERNFYGHHAEECLPDAVIENRIDGKLLDELGGQQLNMEYMEARDVVFAMTNLVYKLRERLSDYDLVIGDDASARLVTRFMRTCINDVREAKNLPRVKTRFVCGGRVNCASGQDEKIRAYMQEKMDLSCQQRALFVTEHALTGNGIYSVIEHFARERIPFDVAALSIIFKPDFVEEDGSIVLRDGTHTGAQFFFGEVDDSGTAFYRHAANGVTKDPDYPHVRPTKRIRSHKEMMEARKAMDDCAHEIVQKVVLDKEVPI